VPGVIISHSPATSGRYPSLALLPNGNYVASHDAYILTLYRIIDTRRYAGPDRLPTGCRWEQSSGAISRQVRPKLVRERKGGKATSETAKKNIHWQTNIDGNQF
jgi:hypothetical protein